MKYYAIGSSVNVKDFTNAKKALETANSALTDIEELFVFKTLKAAQAYAKVIGAQKGKGIEYPVFTVEVAKAPKLTVLADDNNGSVLNLKKNKGNEPVAMEASMAHVNAKFEKVDLALDEDEVSEQENSNDDSNEEASNDASNEVDAAEDKAADDKKADDKKADDKPGFFARNKTALIYGAGSVAAVALASVGAFVSGGTAIAVALAAKAGLALPLMPVVTGAVSTVLGTAAVAVTAGLAKLGQMGYNRFLKADLRTAKEKHDDALKANLAEVEKLEAPLKDKKAPKADKNFVVELEALLNAAPEAKFKNDGELAKRQSKAPNKAVVVNFELEQLRKVAAIKDAKERAKAEVEAVKEIKAKLNA